MEADKSVFLMARTSENTARVQGPTEGFPRKVAVRVLETPLAEEGFVGAAIGRRLRGLRRSSSSSSSTSSRARSDMIVNSRAPALSAGAGRAGDLPRALGRGDQGRALHSRNIEMWFAHSPDKVVAPSTPTDAKGLIKSCIRDNDLCLFLEHKALYRRIRKRCPTIAAIPIGKAKISARAAI